VAAAIARVGGARAGDRVWDPFCGAAAELVECARLGAVASLHGSDVDASALDAARANVAAAGVAATLAIADARADGPDAVELIVTNPPLGSRVHIDAAQLLCDALPNLARRLAPGGRLAWITPSARRTGPAAERAGLRRTFATSVDLGGVRGTLERWER
jgi:tRNA G10  N-methylase Trm11